MVDHIVDAERIAVDEGTHPSPSPREKALRRHVEHWREMAGKSSASEFSRGQNSGLTIAADSLERTLNFLNVLDGVGQGPTSTTDAPTCSGMNP